MLFSLIKCYFLLFISRLEKGTLGSIFEHKLAPIDPTMEVALVKHGLRNISAFGEDGIGAKRPELQCKMQHTFYTAALASVALACRL